MADLDISGSVIGQRGRLDSGTMPLPLPCAVLIVWNASRRREPATTTRDEGTLLARARALFAFRPDMW
jgi:hypothetical protein